MHDKSSHSGLSGNEFSDKFSLQQFTGYSVLTIFDPWQDVEGASFTYILESKPISLPDSLRMYPVIRVPVKRVVAFSTTHIGFIAVLNEENSIVGVSGPDYVCNENIRQRIREGDIRDIGYSPAVDYETIIGIHPDLAVLYGLNASVTGIADRLQKAGIPTVIIAEYLESDPLGKMEWLKVFAAFYQKEAMADSLFIQSRERYQATEKLLEDVPTRPRVLAGLPWKDTWFMAGGRSFMARLIHDAGGNYLWSDNTSDEYIPLDLETTFMRSWKADYWINTGSAGSLAEIAARDERFTALPVFQNKCIYNNDARLNEFGGNDYWESGVTNPDKILADLVQIFHPGLLRQHHFVYYRKLE